MFYRGNTLLKTENETLQGDFHPYSERNFSIRVNPPSGYDSWDMKMKSIGGTPFSDALMNVKYIFSKKELDEELYEYIGKTKSNIYLYKYKNEFPMGFVFDLKESSESELSNTKVLENQNIIYHTISQDNENIVDILDNSNVVLNNVILKDGIFSQIENEKETYIEYEVDVIDKRILYCYIPKDESENFDYVEVVDAENGNTIGQKRIGINELGMFENERIKVRVHIVDNSKED